MKQKPTLAVCLAVLGLMLVAGMTACNLVGGQTSTLDPEARISTAAAQTISAMRTSPPQPATPTSPPGTAQPRTPEPANTSTSPAPDTSETPGEPGTLCNQATFVRDVTISDGATIPPNSLFTKIWELKNSGSCAWNSSYAVVFAGQGTAMGAPAANSFPANVEIKPGETVQVAVVMRAPSDPGEYKGYWMLRSGDQKPFGLGANGAGPFYVQITVADSFSFVEHLCSAAWSTGNAPLPCPGQEGDSAGYVLSLENPTLEDKQDYEGPGMLTMPQPVAGGVIIGKFPPVIVPDETDFRAVISCAPNSTGCYIGFKVTYRVDNGEEKVLGEWNEGFEGGVTSAVKDLDMVSGRSTAFTFYLTVLGTPEQSRGLWFDPRITK